ncbi:MAG: hypothetical protein AAGJ38_05660 [Planctomycetota bacterium]
MDPSRAIQWITWFNRIGVIAVAFAIPLLMGHGWAFALLAILLPFVPLAMFAAGHFSLLDILLGLLAVPVLSLFGVKCERADDRVDLSAPGQRIMLSFSILFYWGIVASICWVI